jgi:cysteine desulfurase
MATRTAYLDWNANAPLRPEAIAAMSAALARAGNPSSVHQGGRRARQALAEAREQVARLVNVVSSAVVFTSGGTEANNLAVRGVPSRRVIVSAIEHDSVLAAAPKASRIPVDGAGRVDLDALERLLAADAQPALVSIMFANNETGVIQPIAEAAQIAHRHGALLHCDAVQGPAKVAIDCTALDIDLMTLSAHKIGGPMGVGALIVRRDLAIAAQLVGGGQERGHRAGTENLPGIIGFGAAAAAALADLDKANAITALRDEAERRLFAIAPDAVIFGREASRLPNTLAIAMPGVAAATQVIALDLAGVMVSAGAACSSGKVTRSHVLDAMGVPRDLAESAIRISLGWGTRAEDIDQLVEVWGALYTRTRASAA